MRQLLGMIQCHLELVVDRRVGAECRTIGKGFVIVVVLSLKNSQPVELGEKKSAAWLTGPTGSSGC